jgi:hypothetical protein
MISKLIRSPIGFVSSLLFFLWVGLCLMPGCGPVPPTPTPTDTPTPTATPTSTPTPTPTPTPIPILYITNAGGSSVVSFPNPSTTNGNTAPARTVSGAATLLSMPQDIVILPNDEMVVCNGGVITVYANARTANGNLAPSRNVQGLATQLVGPLSLAYDSTRDLLYVGNMGSNQILVFTGVSTSSFNGNLAPARVIGTTTGTPINVPAGLFIDAASDTLYVANDGANNVLVYSAASTRSGADVPPARVINCLTFVGPTDLVVDSVNNLLVTQLGGAVLIFNNASTRNGTITPDLSFTIAGAMFSKIALDTAGNGYISSQIGSVVYSINNIATRNGAITPDRTIQGANTQLNGANGVFLSQ